MQALCGVLDRVETPVSEEGRNNSNTTQTLTKYFGAVLHYHLSDKIAFLDFRHISLLNIINALSQKRMICLRAVSVILYVTGRSSNGFVILTGGYTFNRLTCVIGAY